MSESEKEIHVAQIKKIREEEMEEHEPVSPHMFGEALDGRDLFQALVYVIRRPGENVAKESRKIVTKSRL